MCCAQRHTKQTDNGLDFGLHLFFVTFSNNKYQNHADVNLFFICMKLIHVGFQSELLTQYNVIRESNIILNYLLLCMSPQWCS